MINKIVSLAKPEAGFTFVQHMLGKQQTSLAKRSEYGSANMKSSAEIRVLLAGKKGVEKGYGSHLGNRQGLPHGL